jgi:Heterokaryon incompatibility protein (HET)
MGTTNDQYAALSYVWGNLGYVFQTVKSNYGKLQEFGSLMSVWRVLPATVKDAIILTEKLNIPFLWIDRLCIIQDDEFTMENVSCMASIYAKAYITIVAVSGADADAGLHRLRSSSRPRNYDPYYRFSKSTFSLITQNEKENVWHTRAWTFQERAVSRRCLVFFEETVKFECQTEVWLEHTKLDAMSAEPVKDVQHRDDHEECWKKLDFGWQKGFYPRHSITIVPWPDMAQFNRLLVGFSGRALSKKEDSLRAFIAIMDKFSASFPGGFFYAIPEFNFDASITWQHTKNPGKRKQMFPSWSWLGWEGSSQIGDWDPTSRPSQRTLRRPMVRWQKRESGTGKIVPINNSYYEWERFAVNAIDEPPKGWVRTEAPHNNSLHYTNDLLPQEAIDPYSSEEISFMMYQPVPISQGSLASTKEFWDPFLYGRVQMAQFVIGEPMCQSHPLQLNLYDNNRRWVGIVIPCFNDARGHQEGSKCSVIAVCQATRVRDDSSSQAFDEMGIRSEISTENPYEFVQVLWIRREGKVASRRGTGRIRAKIWEECIIEEIDIVLG